MPLDFELFEQHATGDAYGIFLKGHLWVEAALRRAIEIALVRPDALNLDRMTFAAKVDLSLALGAVASDLERPLREMNKTRNRLAHDLSSDVTEENMAALRDSLSGLAKDAYSVAVIANPDHPLGAHVSAWFFIVLNIIEYSNVRARFEKEHEAQLDSYRLICALNERLGKGLQPSDIWAQQGLPDPPTPDDVWTNDRNADGTRRTLWWQPNQATRQLFRERADPLT